MTVQDVMDGKGAWVLLDLPVPLEPVFVDMERPLEEQFPPGLYLDAVRKMVDEFLPS